MFDKTTGAVIVGFFLGVAATALAIKISYNPARVSVSAAEAAGTTLLRGWRPSPTMPASLIRYGRVICAIPSYPSHSFWATCDAVGMGAERFRVVGFADCDTHVNFNRGCVSVAMVARGNPGGH
jgi:hypothetical protein